MNAQVDTSILFPVARLVQGDLYTPQDKDQQGNPLTIKTGSNAGKPRVNYFFSIAIPKTPGAQHWAQEQWGAKIWQLGHSWWASLIDPRTQQIANPRFAWKVEDGDSPVPNQNGRKNCDREGFPGHWIVNLGSSFATKVFDESGNPLLQPDLVKRGFWVEVLASLSSNENAQNPGIYINHNMVAYRAPGKEIVSGPDPRNVGFGKAALPPGVTAQPLGNTANIPNAMPPVPGAPVGAPIPGAVAAPVAPIAPVVTPTPVMPMPGFIAPPVGGGAVPPPPAGPAAPPAPTVPSVADPLGAPLGFKMVNLNGPRYQAYIQGGWTDAQLMSAGHMVRL